ncbi:Hypothetical predicted protein [Cloeon dipterum]|uniref:Uncharacterized protein n=1 Tax=Cloeon dipterum TaxID=197152 RepID=A0A8S1E562_9INSE|nr:Hypothetical predicted protein [Cloeon dipterum]
MPECSRPDIHSFSTRLIEFALHYPTDDQEPPLLDILSVPTIECVSLNMSCENFHLEDIEKLTAMIASRQILGNLRRLKILVYNIERDFNHCVFRALGAFIKNALKLTHQ